MEEGASEMPRALAALGTTRFVMRLRWFVFLAEACARWEGPSIGLDVLTGGHCFDGTHRGADVTR
jgi:hypothetical protein